MVVANLAGILWVIPLNKQVCYWDKSSAFVETDALIGYAFATPCGNQILSSATFNPRFLREGAP
jgi:hypothetical protein